MTNDDFNKPKPKKFTVDLVQTLNRAAIISSYVCGKPVAFAVRYDKKSSGLQFQIDATNRLVKDRTIVVNMYRNLETCKFVKIFLDTDTVSSASKDYRFRFNGVKPLYQRHIIQFMRERYELHINDRNRECQNYLMITGFKIDDADNDLLFYFIQRKCYNDTTRTDIIRTCGLQLSSKYGADILDKYETFEQSTVKKVNSTKSIFGGFDTVDGSQDDVKEIVKPRNIITPNNLSLSADDALDI